MEKASDADALRNRLIVPTLEFAINESRFYAVHLAGVKTTEIHTVDDLAAVPTVDKRTLVAAGRDALASPGSRAVAHLQFTSGTTGEPFLIHRSVDEISFIQEFFSGLSHDNKPHVAPIVVQLPNPRHGIATPIPGNAFVVQVSPTVDLDTMLHFLARQYDFPGCQSRATMLCGPANDIMALTDAIQEKGIDARERFSINRVFVNGRYVTRRWRSLIEQVWGAGFSDCYSMTEIFGGAPLCDQCGSYHFDAHVVPEVLDLSDGQPIREGIGRLHLTALHPFVQLQPMIRYRTGDLFRVDLNTCTRPSYYPLGREVHSLVIDNDVLLPSATLFDIVDTQPALTRPTDGPHWGSYGNVTGYPYVRGSTEGRKVSLYLELAWAPHLNQSRTAEVLDCIRTGILDACPLLAKKVGHGLIDFGVLAAQKGSISSLDRFSTIWSYQ